MQGIASAAASRVIRREHASRAPHFRGERLRGMHSSDRQLPAIRGQLGSLRHHVAEGVYQTQEGTIGEDQDLVIEPLFRLVKRLDFSPRIPSVEEVVALLH